MNQPWSIQLFGTFKITQGHRQIQRFRSHRTAALLAYLAFHYQHPQPREILIDLFWPEFQPEPSRNNLSKAISFLRQQLEPPGVPHGAVLLADRYHVQLNPNAIVTDVQRFEEAIRSGDLEGALTLYQGELLPGFYDEWIFPQQRHLAEQLVQAACHGIARLEREGNWNRAVELARLALSREPHREELQQEMERLKACSRVLASPASEPESAPAPLPVAPVLPIRLPIQFTRFFGREAELHQLGEWLAVDPCLVTLSGPGGSGKTRLAIEAARRGAPYFRGGVWFVSLVSLSGPRQIPGAIRDALELPDLPGRDPLEQVVEFLRERKAPSLLVLDNLEQLLSEDADDGAIVVQALRERVASLSLLTTSRQWLDLEGEREFLVLPLPVPEVGACPADISSIASVALFVDRAQSHRADFAFTTHNAVQIGELCRRLEGIPLALELAAARIRSMTIEELNARLDDRFKLLTGGPRTSLPRHRTLREMVDWSYNLLSEAEQTLLRRLSVFSGGWTIEAAAQVCSDAIVDEYRILDLLSALVDKCLVLAESEGETTRYRMLETIRQYGKERLQESGEEKASRTRHLEYFLALARKFHTSVYGSSSLEEFKFWDDMAARERANFHAALERFPGDDALQEDRLRLATVGIGGWVDGSEGWVLRDYLLEALEESRSHARTAVRAEALGAAGMAIMFHGGPLSAGDLFQESLEIYRELGDQNEIIHTLVGLGWYGNFAGEFAAARSALEEAIALSQAAGIPHSERRGIGELARGSLLQNDLAATRRYLDEAAAIPLPAGVFGGPWESEEAAILLLEEGKLESSRAVLEKKMAPGPVVNNDFGNAKGQLALGLVVQAQGDLGEASRLFREALAFFSKCPSCEGLCWRSVEALAGVYGDLFHWEIAARLWGAAAAVRGDGCWFPLMKHRYERQSAPVRAALGEKGFRAAWAEGRAMTLEQAVEYALAKYPTKL